MGPTWVKIIKKIPPNLRYYIHFRVFCAIFPDGKCLSKADQNTGLTSLAGRLISHLDALEDVEVTYKLLEIAKITTRKKRDKSTDHIFIKIGF